MFCMAPLSSGLSAQNPVESNHRFLEKSLAEFTSPLLDTLQSKKGEVILLSSAATNSGLEQAALFLEDIVLSQLVDSGFQVYLPSEKQPSTEQVPALQQLRLEIVLDEWQLVARRNADEKSDHKIQQEFRLIFRYRILKADGKVLAAGSKAGQSRRLFETMRTFQEAQEGQPAFATAEPAFTIEKNDILNTIIIAGITGLSVLLIYSLRSQ